MVTTMTTVQDRIKNTIGDLVIQLHSALARVDELEAELAKRPEPVKPDDVKAYEDAA